MFSNKIARLYLCGALLAIVLVQLISPTSAIVGGTSAQPGQFPYMALIMTGDVASCGGVILSRNYILTAAHCVTDKVDPKDKNSPVVLRDNVQVMVGQTARDKAMAISKSVRRNPRFSKDDPIKKVAKIIKHPKFNRASALYHDIAILKLAEALKYDKIYLSIQLDTNTLPDIAEVTIAGWGRNTPDPNRIGTAQNDLQFTTLKTKKCPQSYTIEASICMKPSGSRSTGGDSGGPLIYKGKLAGILVTSDPWIMFALRTHTKDMLQWIKKTAEL